MTVLKGSRTGTRNCSMQPCLQYPPASSRDVITRGKLDSLSPKKILNGEHKDAHPNEDTEKLWRAPLLKKTNAVLGSVPHRLLWSSTGYGQEWGSRE